MAVKKLTWKRRVLECQFCERRFRAEREAELKGVCPKCGHELEPKEIETTGKNYQIDFYRNGKRIRKTLKGIDTYAKAKKYEEGSILFGTEEAFGSQDHTDMANRIKNDLTACNIGAVGELKVCIDLMLRGFFVFKAVNPNCFCDLMACKKGEHPYTIEVKVASHVNRKMLKGDYDVLAVVSEEGISYHRAKSRVPLVGFHTLKKLNSGD